jgi:hypothetical protein
LGLSTGIDQGQVSGKKPEGGRDGRIVGVHQHDQAVFQIGDQESLGFLVCPISLVEQGG